MGTGVYRKHHNLFACNAVITRRSGHKSYMNRRDGEVVWVTDLMVLTAPLSFRTRSTVGVSTLVVIETPRRRQNRGVMPSQCSKTIGRSISKAINSRTTQYGYHIRLHDDDQDRGVKVHGTFFARQR